MKLFGKNKLDERRLSDPLAGIESELPDAPEEEPVRKKGLWRAANKNKSGKIIRAEDAEKILESGH